jgi:hypothetical protein
MSLRECRLIVERLFVAAGTRHGLVPSAREATVAAEVLGLGALRAIHEDDQLIVQKGSPVVRTSLNADNEVVVDADGALSVFVAPAVRDLLLENGPETRIRVVGARHPEWIASLTVTPGLEGVVVAVDGADATASFEVDPAAAQERSAHVHAAIARSERVGLDADADLWFGLYTRSNGALAEDTALSRAHAGYRDVDETGRIVKQMDDDSDLEHALLQSRSV